MSLWIEVSVGPRHNKKKIAEIHGWNVSDLADVSDYEFKAEEYGAEHLGIEPSYIEGKLYSHNRNQSVWSLVFKMVECLKPETWSDKNET